jgi:hypothetical protein
MSHLGQTLPRHFAASAAEMPRIADIATRQSHKGYASVLSGPPINKINDLADTSAALATAIGDSSLTLDCKDK